MGHLQYSRHSFHSPLARCKAKEILHADELRRIRAFCIRLMLSKIEKLGQTVKQFCHSTDLCVDGELDFIAFTESIRNVDQKGGVGEVDGVATGL